MAELKLYFSMVSGDMYYIEADEVGILDNTQIPLIKKPKPTCKQCYGRFYTGFDTVKKYYIPCPKCVRGCVDWSVMKEDPVVETVKTTNEIADHEFIKAAEGYGIEGE